MNTAHAHVRRDSRLKLAELTSSVGAGILGAGIGILLAGYLSGLGLPILVLGLVLHSWGMRDKHALESGVAPVWWSTALYWSCWLALAGLAIYAVARAVGAV